MCQSPCWQEIPTHQTWACPATFFSLEYLTWNKFNDLPVQPDVAKQHYPRNKNCLLTYAKFSKLRWINSSSGSSSHSWKLFSPNIFTHRCAVRHFKMETNRQLDTGVGPPGLKPVWCEIWSINCTEMSLCTRVVRGLFFLGALCLAKFCF